MLLFCPSGLSGIFLKKPEGLRTSRNDRKDKNVAVLMTVLVTYNFSLFAFLGTICAIEVKEGP
jgi:hypothetical protein